MASPSHPFRAVGAVLVGVVLLPIAVLGVSGAVFDAGAVRLVWAAMGLAGVAGVVGAARTVVDVARAGREETRRAREARAGTSGTLVLARWRVDRREARAFAGREWRGRKVEVVSTAAGILVLGSALLGWTQDGPAWAAVAAAGFVAVLYVGIGLGKYGMEYRAAAGGADEVVLYPDAALVLGSWHALAGERALVGVEVAEDALVLTVAWSTRDGATVTDTVRVPVPAEARAEAEEAAAWLRARIAER